MNFIRALQSKETKENTLKAKFVFIGFILILALVYFAINTTKVSAVTTGEVTGSYYKKDGTTFADYEDVVIENGDDKLAFIQGNGEDSEVAIKFIVKDFPSNATSFMVVESQYSDSGVGDADRYSLNDSGEWEASTSNRVTNGITGSVEFEIDENDKINARIVYRIRNGSYGLKFLKVFFYEAAISESKPSSSIEVFYVISRPIDTVETGTTCNERGTTICTDYVEGDLTRESRELKIYIPETVAYIFKALNGDALTSEYITGNYNVKSLSTIYAINYFIEDEDSGSVSVVTNKNSANRTYLYTDFFKEGLDTQQTVDKVVEEGNAKYLNYLNSYKANEISYIKMEVDSTGSYFFCITDIFGNEKEIKQDVKDVKNRSIETIIKKGNATVNGYGAEETFTNESVEVTLTMTVKTNFEWGLCLNEKCVKIIPLTKDNVAKIRYWRVDVQIVDGVDRDAYIAGDLISKDYASETYAAAGSTYNLVCKTASDCTGIQVYNSDNKNLETGAGFSSFEENVLTMYIGVSGRYRFYIEDIYQNNTWGSNGDRNIEEYRNPRVEVYAIDKAGPEITFEHNGLVNVEGDDLTSFDIESYAYYRGISLEKDENGKFVLDATVEGTAAVEKNITSYIYYKADRDEKRTEDLDFTNDLAISLSHARVSEYVYYYGNSKDLYSDFSTYDRVGENGPYYQLKKYIDGENEFTYDNTREYTISMNTKNNSNGLKLTSGVFGFNEINYYHNDGDKGVCEQLGSIEGYTDYLTKTELECVDYYLDHSVDFIIEFVAEDSVGNITTNRVYVNVVDTTPAGFTAYDSSANAVKASNIGTDCRMEIGQEIGQGKTQNKTAILNCYNVILSGRYSFEDNMYSEDENDGLSFYNRINNNGHVKLYMLTDSGSWSDLETNTFIPNKTGYYDMKIEIHDNTVEASGTNVLTILVSYYVDKKIVLIEPVKNEKFYGADDPTFDYCVYIDESNNHEIRFSDNPYSNLSIFTKIFCTEVTETNTADVIEAGKQKLFQNNTDSGFGGALSRLESIWYNANLDDPIWFSEGIGVENNYVGLYRLILGTLNINVLDEYGDDTGVSDEDYIVKIHPTFRDQTKYNGTENGNIIIDATNPTVTTNLDNNPLEDDNPYTQSNVDFTIKQIVVRVSATGGSKNYGDKDTNQGNFDNDSATNKYLGGFTTLGLLNYGQYTDSASVILGVLRREVGENVGVYSICNYRGLLKGENDLLDTDLEDVNNMYLDCLDSQTSGITFNSDVDDFSGYTYVNGIMVINANYLRSRALYVKPNESVDGRTLNSTSDARNNNRANYVIEYVGSNYVINSIDLVIQPAPGQRREYNKTDTYDPDPWEIILYGLVDGNIKREENDDAFNGYTVTIIEGSYYEADANANECTDESTNLKCYAAKLSANQSETRSEWNLYHEGVQLKGYKTNETYRLLRSTDASSAAGSAKLVREDGLTGGWYLYYELSNDVNISGISVGTTGISKIAVMTNGMDNCSYDATGHEVTIGGTLPCKNYNLVYNPYYTDEDGYTIENKKATATADEDGLYQDYIYKSFGTSCKILDEEMPCDNTVQEPQKIYKILFEIYRREVILEFNSAIEVIKIDSNTNYEIVYGKRYNFYQNSFFDIEFYEGKTFYPEDYLFICYQDSSFGDSGFDPTNPSSTGCTGDPKYGLTEGDTWSNLGITFKMHEAVSATTSGYYTDSDKAISAGVYYIYSDIAEDQKKNYNFKYLGGTMTIKSLSVEIVITSYLKEYGEAYYSKYGSGTDYTNYSNYTNLCMLDGNMLNSNDSLINLGEGIYCVNADTDFGNTNSNVYGFYVNGLDSKDDIASNFVGRPLRSRSVTDTSDFNGLQENVGTYVLTQGTVFTKNNNIFTACNTQTVKGDYGDCVVTNTDINNYVVVGDPERIYLYDMADNTRDTTSSKPYITTPTVVNGTVYIIPATLTITVTEGQTKMYGCAYNTFNTNKTISQYTYADGYSNCVETTGTYYDLGYKYVVSGDKDYQIANNGYNYTSDDTYEVYGIEGTNFRPTTKEYGIRAHALNSYGTLYRIADNATNRAGIIMSSYVNAAMTAQKVGDDKTYQQQSVGRYILTLGNVDAAENEAKGTYVNSCDINNMPDVNGAYVCKNYHIDYYGTNVSADSSNSQTYVDDEGNFPEELVFEITKRKIYTYVNYDQKIYGDADQDVAYLCGDYNMDGLINEDDEVEGINGDLYHGFCTAEQVGLNTDEDTDNNVSVEYGLTRYYTKYNSLAKAPWNGIGNRDDVQTDVVSGKISRKGMNGNNPQTDDIKGLYEYRYEDFTGTVALKTYGSDNYTINYYEENASGDLLAVNVNGEFVTDGDDGKEYPVQFEIVLRQIKIAFVSFNKVYGEHDNVEDYDVLVCAPSESFDFENMKCVGKSNNDRHGLSLAHISRYMINGVLKQEEFKSDFIVRYKRVLGENVSCGTASEVQITLNGYFFGMDGEITVNGTQFTKKLNCNTTAVSGKSVYETLAYIDQGSSTYPGFNYEVSYEIGYVNITPRPIMITPTSGQGFMYGDYHNTLIPHISFTDSIISGDGIEETYGLVNNTSNTEGICLRNIDYYNNSTTGTKDGGTCFNINDRKDEYDVGSSKTTSSYNASLVNPNTGIPNLANKNYVFGDIYTSETSTRSALGRTYSTVTQTEERYNRNVGSYTITLGDLVDKTGNYTLTLSSTAVTYAVTGATLTVTPESTVYDGTSQTNQYKIYGEDDKELTFKVTTTYTVKYSHFAKYNIKINKVCDSDNVCKTRTQLTTYNYVVESGEYNSVPSGGEYIYLIAGSTVELSDFAYNENMASENLNYGTNKVAAKGDTLEAVLQGSSVSGSMYYDLVCANVPTGVGCDADRTLTYGETNRILLGYLYVDGYAQAAGTYEIQNGFKVANNEFGNKNYGISFVEDVPFTIIPRPVGVQIQNVVKTYGQTTDKISCEIVDGVMITCNAIDGILHSSSDGYLRYNFTIEYFEESTRIESIIGDNKDLYYQNGGFANGLVTKTDYSEYGEAEKKNSDQLGVYVSRDERNTSNNTCLYENDTFGFCEDAGTYYLRFYGYAAKTDTITANDYAAIYKPSTIKYTGMENSVSTYYYGSYWGYNPNYFVIVVESDTDTTTEDDETAVESVFVNNATTTSRTNDAGEKLLKSTGTLKINKKDVKIYVNTSLNGENPEIYYVQQNTNPPKLPTINNTYDLVYEDFDTDRSDAIGGSSTYGNAIWGRHSTQVRTRDKLVGELAYCDSIITEAAYGVIRDDGLTADYTCTNLIYEDNKNSLNTNLEGYVPIVRDTNMFSIVSATSTEANKTYETTNYTTTFYPGGLRIAEDDTKPVVQVNRPDVYIEANAVGDYLYECVAQNSSTTYTNCSGLNVVGKTELVEGTPILDWLNNTTNYATVVKVDLPTILGCEDSNLYECTTSAYYQYNYGKGQSGFATTGIVNGVESTIVEPFVMQKYDGDGNLVYLKNGGPSNLKELVITLVSWFGVTAYDQGEVRGSELLDKHFDKYWYIVIEQLGTNGEFNISRVGEYKVHFYVMDNAGNVSHGNMYDGNALETTYNNVGTLHIIDTTKPVVGTLNLYNGKVTCPTPDNTTPVDCTVEDAWVVAEDTYLPINILGRYDSNGNPTENGEFVIVDKATNMVTLTAVQKYSKVESASGASYVVDNTFGKYVKIAQGASALALKHYGWSNSSSGIWLTITGGSDNSFTEKSFPARVEGATELKDDSQWNHYYSRDGGITWFLYDRIAKDSVLALDSEGTREIMIKAVDSGVKIESLTEQTVTYVDKYYGTSNPNNVTKTMKKYDIVDTVQYDTWLKTFEGWSEELKTENDATRQDKLNYVGWNVSDWAANDKAMAKTISLLIYGIKAEREAGDDAALQVSGYKYFRDKQTAYLDTVSPIITFGPTNGEKLYVYEYGCSFCSNGYSEKFAVAMDNYPESNTSREVASSNYNKNNSIVINHKIFDSAVEGSGYQGDYTSVGQEVIKVNSAVGGLGSDRYVMNGENTRYDIRNVYKEERKYIIYAFDEDDNRTIYDLSGLIPTTNDTTDAGYSEDEIYNVIMNTIPDDHDEDLTYTIVYSVIDKAGNESVYIARGLAFVRLIPKIEVGIETEETEIEEVAEDTYYLNVEQGTDVEQLVNSLVISAADRTNYITQTVYHNGELIVDDKRLDPNQIYDGFTTNTPGVYEITYNLSFMHYGEEGQSEMLNAKPIKLVINVSATPPVANSDIKLNYSSIIMLLSLIAGGIFIALAVVSNKKKI